MLLISSSYLILGILWYKCKYDFFLIFHSSSLLIVCRHSPDFCILILRPATLLNLLIISNIFFGVSSVFYIKYHAIYKQWRRMMTFSLLPFELDIFVFCLFVCLFFTSVARTSDTVFMKSDECSSFSWSYWQRKVFQTFTVQYHLAMELSYVYYMEILFLYTHFI